MNWMKKCVGLSTDREKAMSGKLTGLAWKVKEVAPEC